MLTAKQKCFLAACRTEGTVAGAARLAGVNRTSVYRWLADPAFAAARQSALRDLMRARLEKVLAAEAARRRWREERERARRPMRCHNLALARAAKGETLGW